MGNGKWEINELDDNSALFREYNEGDVISLDTLTKILKPLVSSKENDCCGNQIFSFNLLGKIKYGLQDKGREIERKKQERKDRFNKKVKGITDWFTDDIDKETATSFLRKNYPGAKVGKLEKYNDIDGANFKVLFGVPSEKKFYVGVLHRNGNDIRLLDDSYDAETPLRSFKDQDKCLEFYENYPYGKKEDNVSEQQENNAESNVADDFEGGSDYMKGETGESDGVEWEVVASLKKKKSKYNGKNVTGYEDGMLGDMAVASSRHIFSMFLCNNFVWQSDTKSKNYVKPENFKAKSYLQKLNDLGFEIVKYGIITRPFEPEYNQSNSDLAIQFKKPGEEWIGTIHIKDSVGSYRYSYKGISSKDYYSLDNLDELLNIPTPKN